MMPKSLIFTTWALTCLGLLTSCGGGGGGGASGGAGSSSSSMISSLGLAGNWSAANGSGDVMTISSSGAVTSSACASQGQISSVTPNNTCQQGSGLNCGTASVTTSVTNAANGCAPLGVTSCTYAVSATQLSYNCGATTLTYNKVASTTSVGSGQCANVSYNAAQTITFYGTIQQGAGVMGDLSAYGYGAQTYAGSNYYRNLSTGDSVNVYVSGSTAYATLSISANTAAAIVAGQSASGGSAQICGMEINESVFASPMSGAGYTGTMGGGYVKLWGNGNWITYGPQYGYQPILF